MRRAEMAYREMVRHHSLKPPEPEFTAEAMRQRLLESGKLWEHVKFEIRKAVDDFGQNFYHHRDRAVYDLYAEKLTDLGFKVELSSSGGTYISW
jgi:hypothetical protein